MKTALVIHGHFYQPPRENPWTGVLEREPSASPDHDWNERIFRQCYRPNAYARILNDYGRVGRIVNNYSLISFNFGPTLLSWVEQYHPETYQRILEADRVSAERNGGHGNAIAQAYNHAILPLMTDRDRRTQIRWGLADFRQRFRRSAEALWLPETACNDATIEALIDEGLRFVILSPYQAESIREPGSSHWHSVADGSIDPGRVYKYYHRDGSGRSIAMFFYDGPVARAAAFEGALASSQALIGRLAQAPGGHGRLVHIATDGESYGHHAEFGERALAHGLCVEAEKRGFSLTNYGAFLDQNPPQVEVRIKPGPGGEGTAWSCAHGVGRWQRDCGCSAGARGGWNQVWRGPLRQALDRLRDEAAQLFEQSRDELFADPWAARDHYIDLMLHREASREDWLHAHSGRRLPGRAQVRALMLLEIQRYAQLMYTSCGWFFADISGIETVQIMKYAGRMLDLMEDLGSMQSRDQFLSMLSEAKSNLPEMGSGADVFSRFVEPLRVSPSRVAVHLGLSAVIRDTNNQGSVAGYNFQRSLERRQQQGRMTLLTARYELEDSATGRCYDYALAALYFGGVDFFCALRPSASVQSFNLSAGRLWSAFRTATLPTMLRLATEQFGPEEHGLESLLSEGRQMIGEHLFADIVDRFAQEHVFLYESNQRVLEILGQSGFAFPAELRAAAEFALSRQFNTEIVRANGSRKVSDYQRAVQIATEAASRGFVLDRAPAERTFADLIAQAISEAIDHPTSERISTAESLASLASRLGLEACFGRSQELLFPQLHIPEFALVLRPLALAIGIAP